MLIDWFTIGAQVLNFLILVWLMRRFLYQPILDAIDTREKHIAAELADAASKQAEAKQEREEFERKNEDLDGQRVLLLRKATDEARDEKKRLFDEARGAADALAAKREEALERGVQDLRQALQARTQREVFAIARKVLAELTSTSLEERLGAVFTRRLGELDGPARLAMGAAIRGAPEPAQVRSAFDMTADQRAIIQNAVNETFSADVRLSFVTAPELVTGIELTTNGMKVAWSISDYLQSLESRVGELLGRGDAAAASSAQNPPDPEAPARDAAAQ
ncbi:F0F1 ATP synthase subunit delta [Myxococcota bacterium]|nr:F0F1 ATP synthase subunit delta [Myxococcota bacterium]